MKLVSKFFVCSSLVTSFSLQAAVEINLHRDIQPLVLEGKEVGFSLSKKDKIVLPNGTNQIVVRVAKLVENMGEKEKFNSKPQVFTITGKDTVLFLKPGMKIIRSNHVEQFEQSPQYELISTEGHKVDYTYTTLPALSGITRDYVKELDSFNQQNGIALVDDKIISDTTPRQEEAQTKSQEMMMYWFNKASESDKSQFIGWAYKNKDIVDLKALEGTKELEMVSYWYLESNPSLRKELLSWAVKQ